MINRQHYIDLLNECFNEAQEGDFIPALFVKKCMEEMKDAIEAHKSITEIYRDSLSTGVLKVDPKINLPNK